MNIESILKLSHELRLFGIHQNAERRSSQAAAESLHPLELIYLLLEDEISFRKSKVAKAFMTRANFRSHASLEDWDQSVERGLSKAKLKEIATLGFYQDRESLILVGPTGTGKTHLAIALGRRLCLESIRVKFYSTNLFFEEVNRRNSPHFH